MKLFRNCQILYENSAKCEFPWKIQENIFDILVSPDGLLLKMSFHFSVFLCKKKVKLKLGYYLTSKVINMNA